LRSLSVNFSFFATLPSPKGPVIGDYDGAFSLEKIMIVGTAKPVHPENFNGWYVPAQKSGHIFALTVGDNVLVVIFQSELMLRQFMTQAKFNNWDEQCVQITNAHIFLREIIKSGKIVVPNPVLAYDNHVEGRPLMLLDNGVKN
jgi:hypothetical protein